LRDSHAQTYIPSYGSVLACNNAELNASTCYVVVDLNQFSQFYSSEKTPRVC